MPSAAPIRPITTLRSLTTELEASLTLAAADPAKEHVHRLRTLTRRVEAQLTLLDLLGLSPAASHRHLTRHLRKVRRAAGTVRDLDVQRSALKEPPAAAPETPAAPDTSASQGTSASQDTGSRPTHARAAHRLRRHLHHLRSAAARDLRHALARRAPKLARRIESLLAALPAESAIPPAQLVSLIRSWYTARLANELHLDAAAPLDPATLSPDGLHTIRKVAKLARYLAEGAASPSAPALTGLGQHFEALQNIGGEWHDALTLAQLARHVLGRKNALTRALTAATGHQLHLYTERLAAFHP